ncbi:MAG: hypothetical protein ABSE45_11285 [Candidatus Acidiferrales bacterium]|jgi:hypothetical protein
MAGPAVNLLFLMLVVSGVTLGIIAPLTFLIMIFWKWRKELAQSGRLRQAKTTQIR